MKTHYWKVSDQAGPAHPSIQAAAKLIQHGKVVAFPTETVYGLGADARNSAAVSQIFKAKGRPSDNPLIVHIANAQQLESLVQPLPPLAIRLIERFWPGPLTLVLPLRKDAVSELVSAGLSTLAVRMPAHPVALSLIEAANVPVAAPSANQSGRPSPTQASHVLNDLNGLIDGIIDGGNSTLGLESTVVSVLSNERVEILRPGGVSYEDLINALPNNEVLYADQNDGDRPRSPGMKYAHYAPRGELIIVQSNDPSQWRDWVKEQLQIAHAKGLRAGVLSFYQGCDKFAEADHVICLGGEPERAASRLYQALREFDHLNIDVIFSETCHPDGLGYAMMNRLHKAAAHQIVQI